MGMPSSFLSSSFYTLGHEHWGMAEELPPLPKGHGGAELLGRYSVFLSAGHQEPNYYR